MEPISPKFTVRFFCSFLFDKNTITINENKVKLSDNERGYNEQGYNEQGYNEHGYNERIKLGNISCPKSSIYKYIIFHGYKL